MVRLIQKSASASQTAPSAIVTLEIRHCSAAVDAGKVLAGITALCPVPDTLTLLTVPEEPFRH